MPSWCILKGGKKCNINILWDTLQVGFLSAICISCYELLYKLVPESEQLLEGCKENLGRWKAVAEAHKKEPKKTEDKDEGAEKALE